MDSHHTQTVLTTSHEELDRYKELYKQYLEAIVNVHNMHLSLMNGRVIHTRVAFRNQLKAMSKVINEMKKQAMKVHAEAQSNARIETKKKRIEKRNYKEDRKRSKWTIPPSQMR